MNLKGKRFCVRFLGCRVNGAEAEALMSALEDQGAVEDSQAFDLAIVVTCGVTSMADKKSRQMLSSLRKQRPEAFIVACGCWAQEADVDEVQKLGVDLLVGNRQKGQIINLIQHHGQQFTEYRPGFDGPWDPLEAYGSAHHSRALIKVQEGCNCSCTYCAVPALRGPSISRPLDSIMTECERILEKGVTELVLTGVHLGLWGRDLGLDLADLLEQAGTLLGLKRLRLGSLEPFGMSKRLFDVMSRLSVFAPHLHLPLQSGSRRIAKLMRRPGGPDGFLRQVKSAREALGEDLHISTDVMVGFPGETDKDFQETIQVLEQARVGRVHPFIYSPRPGTLAAQFSDQIEHQISAMRLKKVMAWGSDALQKEALRWIGRPQKVFVEKEGKGNPKGYNDSWIEVRLNPEQQRGIWTEVIPQKAVDGVLYL